MKKLKNTKGFTLVEVLVATAILAIFVSMAIIGTSALFGTGEQMMTVAKAAVLGSDVMKAITNEVRFGEEFSLETAEEGKAATITYGSTSYGAGCRFSVDESGQLVILQISTGTDAAGKATSITKKFYPIGSAAYDEVRIKSMEFSIEEGSTRQNISCTLAITSDGTNTLWQKTMTVVPLSQKSS